jgi:predicted CoA-substrate-specific enzyme activase
MLVESRTNWCALCHYKEETKLESMKQTPSSMKSPMRLGIDIGSTTIKLAVLDQKDTLVFHQYLRHYANLQETLRYALLKLYETFGNQAMNMAITGSGSLGIAELLGIPFIQEVTCGYKAIQRFLPEASVIIEIGGEDSKITFLDHGVDQKMNGICAGGTGAFIDQMSLLLNTDANGLNTLAQSHNAIYPIAARCGVFAKTDIQPLLSEGAPKEDIAASIFQAVVNQTISGLAGGRLIQGKVIFLGGPLRFLPELRKRFQETLGLSDHQTILPNHAEVYVAIGAALEAARMQPSILLRLQDLVARLDHNPLNTVSSTLKLQPLFQNQVEYEAFLNRHQKQTIAYKSLATHAGPCFLGLDIGSTTSKAVLLDSDNSLLYSYYAHNDGSPLDAALYILKNIYEQMPSSAFIAQAAVTGYGEKLIKTALCCDMGEVETLCHYKAATFFMPNVELILDIGGQDMKCIKVKDGVINDVILNEACSSGCGSFIEAFAQSLNMNMEDFVKLSLFAQSPADLGTRCTVFMNSKVKQAQKEGFALENITAGLCYSIIKNALYKVLKVKSATDLGTHIMVQGGTFLNDAVLRVLEIIIGQKVTRPALPHLMGALGAAILAKEAWQPGFSSQIVSCYQLESFSYKTHTARCNKCANQCLLTISKFNGHSQHVTGYHCEKGAAQYINNKINLPNLYDYKLKRLFEYYQPLAFDKAFRGTIGIPRVLNMYENYPFWFTFFSHLGFRVIISPPSGRSLYEMGMDTIASDTACYPAKLVHGHIKALVQQRVERIFYPCLPFELPEIKQADRSYNCPMIIAYPEVIKANVDELQTGQITFHNPFLPYNNTRKLIERLCEEFRELGISRQEIAAAVNEGRLEDRRFKADICRKGEETLKWLEATKHKGIVLAGRPYHLDPEIHHGIPGLITALDMAVFTEDSIAHLGKVKRPLRVLDQWMYHSRLYEACDFVAKHPQLEMVQLNSFGCGPDSIAAQQAEEILNQAGKSYTILKIDEGHQLGAVNIRLRSLKAALLQKSNIPSSRNSTKTFDYNKPVVIKNIRKKHTILAPQMAPIHFELIEAAICSEGVKLEVLPTVEQSDIELGLKYVNNDSCYPSIMMIGQILNALQSGKYDLNHTSILMSQTGGPCRASNYLALLKKALKDVGLDNIPVLSLNLASLYHPAGFKITATMLKKAVMAVIYGDLLMKLLLQVRPYEKIAGAADNLYSYWMQQCKNNLQAGNRLQFKKTLKQIVISFDQLDTCYKPKPKVGLAGEIMVKYHPTANKNMAKFIEAAGAELMVPGFAEFFLYCAYDRIINEQYLDGSKLSKTLANLLIRYIEGYRDDLRQALQLSQKFKPPAHIKNMAESVQSMLSLCNQSGEGWLLTAEMTELIEEGANNIICMQPFACLPNHITGRGMLKLLKSKYPQANVVTIDYDPGASDTHQINRIRLMLDRAISAGS